MIAVNFGGCVVPTGIAAYQLLFLVAAGALTSWRWALAARCGLLLHRPAGAGGGAAILALLFAPGDAAPVCYVAGVARPLIGADVLPRGNRSECGRCGQHQRVA